jgi:hypothetical protein
VNASARIPEQNQKPTTACDRSSQSNLPNVSASWRSSTKALERRVPRSSRLDLEDASSLGPPMAPNLGATHPDWREAACSGNWFIRASCDVWNQLQRLWNRQIAVCFDPIGCPAGPPFFVGSRSQVGNLVLCRSSQNRGAGMLLSSIMFEHLSRCKWKKCKWNGFSVPDSLEIQDLSSSDQGQIHLAESNRAAARSALIGSARRSTGHRPMQFWGGRGGKSPFSLFLQGRHGFQCRRPG